MTHRPAFRYRFGAALASPLFYVGLIVLLAIVVAIQAVLPGLPAFAAALAVSYFGASMLIDFAAARKERS